jgi:hypothetical protein
MYLLSVIDVFCIKYANYYCFGINNHIGHCYVEHSYSAAGNSLITFEDSAVTTIQILDF